MNYAIVRETLVEEGFQDYHAGQSECMIHDVRYWEPEKSPIEPNALYLVAADSEEKIGPSAECLICMTVEAAENVLRHAPQADILIAPSALSSWAVLESVWDIMREYERWNQALLRSALQGESIAAFLSIAAQKLKNPLAVFDQNFRILARSEIKDTLPEGTIWDRIRGERFNMIEYYNAKERKLIGRALRDSMHHDILYRPVRDQEHYYYSAQLEIDGHPAGCIGIVDVFAPLSAGQCAIARQIRDLLGDYLRRNMRNLMLDEASKGFWYNLITGKAVDRETLSEKKAACGWRNEDGFITIAFLPMESYSSQSEISAAMNYILMTFPLSYIAVDGQTILMLVRTSDYGDSLFEKAIALAQELELCIGFSYVFHNLSYCAAAYRQSTYAGLIAHSSKQTSVSFKTVHSNFILDLLAQHEPIQACIDPRLLQLANSTRESDRVLIPCLKAYLLNGRNIADTARALFLHRNTVIYRIEKLTR